MNYLTAAEFLIYYDKRRVYELLSDSGSPLTDGTYPANLTIAALIRQASAHIDSACQTGRRYERTQLEDIVTAANSGSATEAEKKRAEPIKTLCAHLTWGFLIARRGHAATKLAELAPMFDWAQQMLNDLATGQRIFDLELPKAAGIPRTAEIGTRLYSWTLASPLFGVFPSSPAQYLYPNYYGG